MKTAPQNTGKASSLTIAARTLVALVAIASIVSISPTASAQQPGTLQIGIDNNIAGVADGSVIITRDYNLHFYTLDTQTGAFSTHGPWLNYTIQLNNSRNPHVGMAEDANGNVYSLHEDGYIYHWVSGSGTLMNNSRNLWDSLQNWGTDVVARHTRTNTWYVWASPTSQYPHATLNALQSMGGIAPTGQVLLP
jgi:hypothetical protein